MAVSNYVVGILVALCTTFLSAFGLALQKRVHGKLSLQREELLRKNKPTVTQSTTTPATNVPSSTKDKTKNPKYLRSYYQPLWIIGLLCLISSSLLSLIVFSLLGQAVASAMASITIIWNLILARLLLKEIFTFIDGIVTIFLLIGAVTAVVCGRQGSTIESALSPRTIQNLWTRDAVIIFTPLIGVAMLICIFYNYFLKERRKLRMATRRQIQIGEILLLFLSGCFSGFTGLLSRGFVSLLSYAIQDNAKAVFTWWGSYMFAFFLIPSLICQVACVNAGLKMADATEVVPQYQSWIVTLGVIFGYIYYNEGAGKSTGALIGFWVGIILIIIGICLLLLKRKPEPSSLLLAREINDILIHNTVPVLLDATPTIEPRTIPLDTSHSFQRSHSAPPGMLRKDKELLSSPRIPIILNHTGRISIQRNTNTIQKYVKLKQYGEDQTVSDEELLYSPRPPKGFIGVPGIEDYIPPSIEIQACYPIVPAMVSAPIHDARYYRSLHVISLCQLQTTKFITTSIPITKETINISPSVGLEETKYSHIDTVMNNGDSTIIDTIPNSLPKTTKRAPQRWYNEAHRHRPSTPTAPIPAVPSHAVKPSEVPNKATPGHKHRQTFSAVVTDLWKMEASNKDKQGIPRSSMPNRLSVTTSPKDTTTVPSSPSHKTPGVSYLIEPAYVRIPVALTKYVSISPTIVAAGLRLKAAEERADNLLTQRLPIIPRLLNIPDQIFHRKKQISHKSFRTVTPFPPPKVVSSSPSSQPSHPPSTTIELPSSKIYFSTPESKDAI